jgi:RNA polymerase sigma factor (sigma-70 family)
VVPVDLEERNRLVEENMGLVRSVARRFAFTGREFEDLVQEGTLGLIRAANSYDPERGFAFSSHAWASIRNAIIGNYRRGEGRTLSLDDPIGEENGVTLLDLIPDNCPSPEETTIRSSLWDSIVPELSPTEATILRMKCGLDGNEYTPDEIAGRVNLSRQGMYNVYNRALKRLSNIVPKRTKGSAFSGGA